MNEDNSGIRGRYSRRSILKGGAGATAAMLALPVFDAFAGDKSVAGAGVQTAAGQGRGAMNGPVHVFKGIPYGAPTGGANRFMPPQKPQAWSGVRDALAYGPRSPQTDATPFMHEEAVDLDLGPMSEDCLYLNVWTAGLGAGVKRPVMVWFHGGGFAGGSGSSVRYDGTNLAHKHGVVLVTVNHRLNAFGFLSLAGIGGDKYAASGNVGMLDIVQSLQWVRDNIARFGGDPHNVTVFGQSGGGGKVSTLMAMPAAKGLFHRAIAQSGLALRQSTAEEAKGAATKLLEALQIGPDNLDQLQALPQERIVAAMAAIKPPLQFRPVVDGQNLPAHPFDPVAPAVSADVPLLLGSTLTEATFFNNTPLDAIDDAALHDHVKQYTHTDDAGADSLIALYRKDRPQADNTFIYQLIATDFWLTQAVTVEAERKAALGAAPAYVYHFEKLTTVHEGKLKSPHTLDIAFAFDNLALSRAVVGEGPELQALADKVSGAWVAFARSGKPGGPGLPKWPPYSAEHRSVMLLNDECKLVEDPHSEERLAIAAIKKPA